MKKKILTVFVLLSLFFIFSLQAQAVETDRFFTGQRQIDNLGVYNFGARFYSPTLGIFIQPDRIEGANRYMYARNNPVSFNDPSGKCGLPCILALIGIAGGMSTMPMASSAPPPDNPCAYGCMTPEQSELNLALWRLNPFIGTPIDIAESRSGRSLASGRQLSGIERGLNLAAPVAESLAATDIAVGSINTLIQTRRVMKYKGGAELLAAGDTLSATGAIARQQPSIVFELLSQDEEASGLYRGYWHSWEGQTIGFKRGRNEVSTLKHEGIHLLQDMNKHPYFTLEYEYNQPLFSLYDQKKFIYNMDLELMAQGAADKGPLLKQLGGALWSTGSSRSPVYQGLGRFLRGTSSSLPYMGPMAQIDITAGRATTIDRMYSQMPNNSFAGGSTRRNLVE